MSIVCSGSVAFDYLMKFPGYFKDHIIPEKLDKISLSFLVDEMTRRPGGTATNICYSLALLKQKPYLFAAVGEDFAEYRERLLSLGVNCDYAKVIPGKFTASCFINTDLSSSQIVSFYTGAMANSDELHLSDAIDAGVNVDLFLISPSDPKAMITYVRQCREDGIPYAFDPSQQLVRMTKDMIRSGIRGAKFLFSNEYEYDLIKKHGDLTDKEIEDMVYCRVTTQGKSGALIKVEGQEYKVPIYPARRRADPTGVGDSFRAGFLCGYLHNLDWDLCGRMGALASTYALEQNGPQSHKYTPKQFAERFRKVWDDKGALDVLLKE